MMKRLALVGILSLCGATILAQTRMPASPRGTSATQIGGTNGKWITVDYGRPILRGRTNIFGAGAEYGKGVLAGAPVWRAGANQTTRLKTELPLVINGRTVAAGEYDVFVDLKENGWTFILSTQPYQETYNASDTVKAWGAFNYDEKYDVLRAPMRTSRNPLSVDQFTIVFTNVTDKGGSLSMMWENTLATIDFKVATEK